jgi:hypothetical protein
MYRALAPALLLLACGDNGGDVAPDAAPLPPGDCVPVIQEFPQEAGQHFPPGSPIAWTMNPPATGKHYSVWAHWDRNYTEVLPRGYWMHNMEHGGVALLHNCPEGCPDDVAALASLTASLPVDAKCTAPIRTRTLITADPELPADVRIAAVAWNFSYTATCLDLPSLRAFIDEHYNHAPESTCADGAFPR